MKPAGYRVQIPVLERLGRGPASRRRGGRGVDTGSGIPFRSGVGRRTGQRVARLPEPAYDVICDLVRVALPQQAGGHLLRWKPCTDPGEPFSYDRVRRRQASEV